MEKVLPRDALYECVCEWLNGNNLYCEVVLKTRKVLYKYRPFTFKVLCTVCNNVCGSGGFKLFYLTLCGTQGSSSQS